MARNLFGSGEAKFLETDTARGSIHLSRWSGNVIRLGSQPGSLLKIYAERTNRDNEYLALSELYEIYPGVPRVTKKGEDDGHAWLEMDHLERLPLDLTSVHNLSRAGSALGKLMRAIHHKTRGARQPLQHKTLDRFKLVLADVQLVVHPKQVEKVLSCQSWVAFPPRSKTALLHRDVRIANCLYSEPDGILSLVDFEHACYGAPLSDLARPLMFEDLPQEFLDGLKEGYVLSKEEYNEIIEVHAPLFAAEMLAWLLKYQLMSKAEPGLIDRLLERLR